jgi:hypothetical protein
MGKSAAVDALACFEILGRINIKNACSFRALQDANRGNYGLN